MEKWRWPAPSEGNYYDDDGHYLGPNFYEICCLLGEAIEVMKGNIPMRRNFYKIAEDAGNRAQPEEPDF